MKAIIKVVWFAIAVVFLQKFGSHIINANTVGSVSDKLTAFFPTAIHNKINTGITKLFKQEVINQLIFVVVLFLGLDLVSGDIKGIIKGPIKLAFNGIIYACGFSIIFFLLSGFSMSF